MNKPLHIFPRQPRSAEPDVDFVGSKLRGLNGLERLDVRAESRVRDGRRLGDRQLLADIARQAIGDAVADGLLSGRAAGGLLGVDEPGDRLVVR